MSDEERIKEIKEKNKAEIIGKIHAAILEFDYPEWKGRSHEAIDFVSAMLTVEASCRPNAEVLLTMPWLHKVAPEPVPISTDIVAKLQEFKMQSTLRTVALVAVASQLPEEEIFDLARVFRTLETSCDGRISIKQIKGSHNNEGHWNTVDYMEFIAATMDKEHYRRADVCKAAFRIFDTNNEGKITRDKLARVLNRDKRTGERVDEIMVEHMIRGCDGSDNGTIDFNAFYALVQSPRSLRFFMEPPRPPPAKQARRL